MAVTTKGKAKSKPNAKAQHRTPVGKGAPKRAPRPKREVRARVAPGPADPALRERVAAAITSLERMSSKATTDGMARYGIPSGNAFGVPVGRIRQLAQRLGRDHVLAGALWKTGWYEARMLSAFVDEPERVTPTQMDRWCRDFDSWAICDTVCFHLFDRSPHAWSKIEGWCEKREEFVKRGGFALLACLALHDRSIGDPPFLESLRWIERGAGDERNFVKKGVSWALR